MAWKWKTRMIIEERYISYVKYAFQRWSILLGLALACCGNAGAQGVVPWLRTVDVSGTYSYIQGNSQGFVYGFRVNGGTANLTFLLNKTFAIVGDFGIYRFGSLPPGVNSMMYTYMAGPRMSLHKFHGLSPFLQVLAGGGRLNASSGGVQAGENGLVMAAGGGLDAPLGEHFSLRLAQAEYMVTRFDHPNATSALQNDVRISAGLVFHFGNRESPL
jgi:hypothetical protein